MNKQLFSEEPKEYSRNNIISNLLEGESFSKMKIIPCFRKKSFLKYFFKREHLVNDFFTGAYESNVLDRKNYHPLSPKAYSYLFKDWFSLYFSKYILTDTYKHFQYWSETLGDTKAEVFVLPVLADKNIYFPQPKEFVKEEKLKVLFTGSFIPLHGIEKIIDSIKILQERSLHIEFKFIGNGQTLPKTKEKVKSLNLESSITFIDKMIPEEDLAKEINRCDIMLGIFGDSTKASVVVPNKVYQGIACGKCVLTMNSSGMREFFNSEEIALVNNTPLSIAEKIQDLYHNRELIEKYSENGFNRYQDLYKKIEIDFKEFLKRVDS